MLYGYDPDIASTLTLATSTARDELSKGRAPAAIDAAERLRQAHETLAQRWKSAAEYQAKYYNAHHKAKKYSVGDLVLLASKNIKLDVPKKKLGPKFLGPFRIIDVVGTQAYRLALPSSTRIHNVFHVSLLEPWKGREGKEHDVSMPVAEEADEWRVEEIVKKRVRKRKTYYLVKWAGWPDEYNTWEPADHVKDTVALDAFEAQASHKHK